MRVPNYGPGTRKKRCSARCGFYAAYESTIFRYAVLSNCGKLLSSVGIYDSVHTIRTHVSDPLFRTNPGTRVILARCLARLTANFTKLPGFHRAIRRQRLTRFLIVNGLIHYTRNLPALHGAGLCRWLGIGIGIDHLSRVSAELTASRLPRTPCIHPMRIGRAGLLGPVSMRDGHLPAPKRRRWEKLGGAATCPRHAIGGVFSATRSVHVSSDREIQTLSPGPMLSQLFRFER
jgi:hypothetical protein